MNRFSRSISQTFNSDHKLLTDRSESHYSNTYRNSTTYPIDKHMHQNHSQIFTKDQKNPYPKLINRKKSISSYFINKSKVNNQKTFNMLQKNLKNQSFYDFKRKRSITTVNLTTNKINPSQQNKKQQRQIIKINPQRLSPNKIFYFCLNHPQKIAYFQEQNASKSYCHHCSIQLAKQNVRLIEITPQIKEIKTLISKKILETQSFGFQICQFVQKMIEENVKNLNQKYRELKMSILTKQSEKITKQYIEFQLKEINWNFMNNIQLMPLPSQLEFLTPKVKHYRINRMINYQIQRNIKTQKSVSQFFYSSPVQSKSEIQNFFEEQNFKPQNNGFSSKNLIKQIEKTLNYQSRESKLKIKKVNLICKPIKVIQDQNKENIASNEIQSKQQQKTIL